MQHVDGHQPCAMTESSALDEISKAVEAGKGWSKEERAAYLKKVSEEEHPMFAENIEVSLQ